MTEEETEYEPIIEESLPAYSSTWENDVANDGGRRWKGKRVGWTLPYGSMKQRAALASKSAVFFLRNKAWPMIKKCKLSKKQVYAFVLLLFGGILPFVAVGVLTS